MSLKSRVRKGAARLDKVIPSWARVVKIKELDMRSCRHCVEGQLARQGYYPVMVDAGLVGFDDRLGFDVAGNEGEADYDALEDLWKAEIRERRRPKAEVA